NDPRAAKLIDLGLARPIGAIDATAGTPAFLAPEAWLGERSAATDLYALGATLHALLGGESDAPSATQDLARALSTPKSQLPASIPDPLRRAVTELVDRDPRTRPSDARDVSARLLAIARGLGAEVDAIEIVAPTRTGRERAARASVARFVGRDAEL